MIGRDLAYDPSLSLPERLYVRLFGVPINGLRIRARRILPLVARRYKSILDAGCGQGVFAFEMARSNPEASVTGYDTDSNLVERNNLIAERAGLANCRFESVDVTESLPREHYDLVLSVDVLEHLSNDESALKQYYNALIPGGDLVLHVPAYLRRWFFFRWRINFDVEGHVRSGYLMGDIAGKVKNAGFTVKSSVYTFGWIETVTNNLSYLITGARMRRKWLYALVFPLLLMASWFGRNSKPSRGSGILIIAGKEPQSDDNVL